MPQAFSTGIEVPTASDRHPSEAWWSRVGATTNAAILNETSRARTDASAAVDALRKTVTQDYVDRATASQYGIPGPASTISIGTVQGGVTAAASMTGTAPAQKLNLTLPQGPRGPEGPGGAFQMVETADPGLFEVSDVPNAALASSVQVAVANATAGAMLSRGIVPANADLNTYRTAAHSGVWELATSRAYVNSPIPADAAGLLVVSVQRAIAYQTVTRTGQTEVWERGSLSSSLWRPWVSTVVMEPALGVSLDALRTQEILLPGVAYANAVTAGWPSGIPRTAAWVVSRVASTGVVFQQMQTYGEDPRLLIRSTGNLAASPPTFSAWKDVTPAAVPPSSSTGGGDSRTANTGLANMLLVQDFTRRRPVVKTGGKPAVALRYDHGLVAFRDKIVPALKRLGLPAAQTLNAGNWDITQNAGVTRSQVNAWVLEGWLEIWNHGLTHTPGSYNAPDTLYTMVKEGLDQLRTDLPAATIDGFMPPGGGGDLTGFDGGRSAEGFWSTAPGRMILQYHAVTSGYWQGTALRTLDGEVRQGQLHYTVDDATLDLMKERVTGTYAGRRGACIMVHPDELDKPGNATAADYVAFLEWLAAERDAGRVRVLGCYDLLRADSRS